jgi:hypothetical protein
MRFVIFATALGAFIALPAQAQDQPAPAADAQPAAAAHQANQPTPQPSDAAQTPTSAQQAQQQAAQEPLVGEHPADPNYRWHSGRWWYWQNGGWLLWNGSRWLNERERAERVSSAAPRRSFSYTEDGPGFVPTDDGIPQSTASGLRRSAVAPGTVEYQRVIPSYGMRSAGSKALGNY